MEEGLGTPIITSDNSLNLDSIPPELVLLILQNLTIPDIQNFCNSTRRHRNLCSSDGFRMIMQQKIEEFKPDLIEMSYQDLMEKCRMYPILQEFCETDDAFWDTKFRLDFADTIRELLEDQEDFYLVRAGKSIYQLLNKEAYEEFMSWDNFMWLLEEDRPDVFSGYLYLGRYLRSDLPDYIEISLQHLDSPDYRRILEYIINDIGFPVSPEVIEKLERSYRKYENV